MRVVIFSGTTEGREICSFFNDRRIYTTVCVATEYGKEIMSESEYIKIHSGRMTKDEMADFISEYDFVIDATHPYAKIVTQNIKDACKDKGIDLVRLLRDEKITKEGEYVDTIEKAVNRIKKLKGNVFVSTGSKEIEAFTRLKDYDQRVYARVLDTEEVKKKCQSLGFKNVLYKKGPFSYENNLRDFKWANAKILVTKSSGTAGGFEEKINAAKSLGMKIIIIKRPKEESGLSINEVKKWIEMKIK